MARTRAARRNDQPRRCFVVISWEGCAFPDVCQAKHYVIDCEVCGTLAHVEQVDTAEFIMRGHMEDPTWPRPEAPLTERALERILASKTGQDGRIFVPRTYRG